MAGLTCAQFLREGGLSVALLEKGFCGAGASGKSSGFVAPASELELSEVIASFGVDRGAASLRRPVRPAARRSGRSSGR